MQDKVAFKKSFPKSNAIFGMQNDKNIINELLQISGNDLRSVAIIIQTVFFFFHSNVSYFLAIDKISENFRVSDDIIAFDYVSSFFYYLKMIIQILFDHDCRL